MSEPRTDSHRLALHSLGGSPRSLAPEDAHALIQYLERRLAEMGEQGDCAYERAMGQVYRSLVTELRETLTVACTPT
jgi:hypothetical protein